MVALKTGAAACVLWLQMSSKLKTALQQQAAERDKQQQQLQELSQQLADAQDQMAWLQQVWPGRLPAGNRQPPTTAVMQAYCCRTPTLTGMLMCCADKH